MKDHQYLHIIGLSDVNHHFLKAMTRAMGDHRAHIVSGQMNTVGNSQSFSYVISSPWHILATLEIKLKALAQKHQIDLFMQKTALPVIQKPMLSYVLSIVALENSYALYHLMRFLSQNNQRVVMTEMLIDSYKTRHTQTAMILLTVHIQLSADTAIADWRESFMLFCDDLNFDAVMEPDKN